MNRREALVGCGIATFTISAGCIGGESDDAGGPGESEAEVSPPEYEIAVSEDISAGDIVRHRIDVWTDDPVDELSDEEFLAIGEDIVTDTIDDQDVNSISIFFWEESATIGAESAYARITWAPDGDLSAATTVSTGDYSDHEYALERLKE